VLGTVLGIIIALAVLPLLSLAFSMEKISKIKNIREQYIYPHFSEKQWAWIRAHYRDRALYIIIDENGRAWAVGAGRFPRPILPDNIIIYDPRPTLPPSCVIENITGTIMIIVFVGQTGGVQSQSVDWFVGANMYWNENSYNWSKIEKIEYYIGWRDSAPSCSDYIIKYSISGGGRRTEIMSYDFRYGEFNVTSIETNLPDASGTYYFTIVVKAVLNTTAGKYNIVRIYYEQVSISEGGSSNPIARAIRHALSWLFSKLEALLDALLPEQLKQLLSSVWQAFMAFLDIFKSAISMIPQLADFFKLFALFIPLLLIIVVIYNPLLVPEFVSDMIEFMRRIVAFIRALLPV